MIKYIIKFLAGLVKFLPWFGPLDKLLLLAMAFQQSCFGFTEMKPLLSVYCVRKCSIRNEKKLARRQTLSPNLGDYTFQLYELFSSGYG